MLRITVQEHQDSLIIKLEGRIVAPWVAELIDFWEETAPHLSSRKLSVDLRDVTYIDADGKRALKDIYTLTGAEFLASTPWTRYLAEEIVATIHRESSEALSKDAEAIPHPQMVDERESSQATMCQMGLTAADHRSMERALQHAIERDELTLHYQPKINVSSEAVVGVEAFSRWADPLRGTVPPVQFLHLAEKSGMILSIGAWVLRQACSQARSWAHAAVPARTVAVNVSESQFYRAGFLDHLLGTLGDTGLNPESLELDIPAEVLMKHPSRAKPILRSIQDKGVRISADNLSISQGGFGSLSKLPINALKIDRSCTRDITSNPDKKAFVKTVIGIAKSKNLTVIAEGVETIEDLDFLREHRCDEAQGFYLGRPAPPWQLARLLSSR
jgi:EAL domain-containing protein (putative c-di-GMP-specific phosphodiesterase class I)